MRNAKIKKAAEVEPKQQKRKIWKSFYRETVGISYYYYCESNQLMFRGIVYAAQDRNDFKINIYQENCWIPFVKAIPMLRCIKLKKNERLEIRIRFWKWWITRRTRIKSCKMYSSR